LRWPVISGGDELDRSARQLVVLIAPGDGAGHFIVADDGSDLGGAGLVALIVRGDGEPRCVGKPIAPPRR
jgi:hypothetical protein